MSNIPDHLKKIINSIPDKPGIYQMMDSEGNIIYIGKSKTLNKRVKSYFYREHKSEKINRMVFHIHNINFITTDTHLEAQILECALIKKIKPIYNTQFKNHKKYSYLKIEDYNRFKPLTIINEKEGKYCFGPYRNTKALTEIIEIFKNIYPITRYEDRYEFEYKILPQPMKKDTFENNKQSLIEILSNIKCMSNIIKQMEIKMEKAASEFHFETASIYRDMINYMRYLHNQNAEENNYFINGRILMGEKIDSGYKIFYIVNGRIILKKKLIKITKEGIRQFLKHGKKLENKAYKIRNKKRDLDFKHIVNAEIRDESTKIILYIEENYNLDKFISKIMNIKEKVTGDGSVSYELYEK